MNIAEVFKRAALILSSEELVAETADAEASDLPCMTAALSIGGEAGMLIDSCVCAVGEMYGSGFAPRKTFELEPCGGAVALPDGYAKVVAVKRDGAPIDYQTTENGIAVDGDCAVTVTLEKAVGELSLTQEIDMQDVASDALVYAAARNFCLVTGRNDEAAVFDERYCAATEKLRISRRARLRARAWLQ